MRLSSDTSSFMKSHALGLAVGFSIFAASSFAADLPANPKPAPLQTSAAAYNWTGAYVGVSLGSAANQSAFSPTPGVAFAEFHPNGNGPVYGAQIGYNYQYDRFVIGAEAAIAQTRVNGSALCAGIAGANCVADQTWLGSLRGKAGFALDRFLAYGVGGLAFSQYRFEQTTLLSQSWGSGARTGWTVGAGAEYALTDHVTVGAEYSYYNFGDKVGSGGQAPAQMRLKVDERAFVGKIDWKF